MGCYDSVSVPCPKCGTKTWFQSKSGDCLLGSYDLKSAPDDVMLDINRHSPHLCQKDDCDAWFFVDPVSRSVILWEGPKVTENRGPGWFEEKGMEMIDFKLSTKEDSYIVFRGKKLPCSAEVKQAFMAWKLGSREVHFNCGNTIHETKESKVTTEGV